MFQTSVAAATSARQAIRLLLSVSSVGAACHFAGIIHLRTQRRSRRSAQQRDKIQRRAEGPRPEHHVHLLVCQLRAGNSGTIHLSRHVRGGARIEAVENAAGNK